MRKVNLHLALFLWTRKWFLWNSTLFFFQLFYKGLHLQKTNCWFLEFEIDFNHWFFFEKDRVGCTCWPQNVSITQCKKNPVLVFCFSMTFGEDYFLKKICLYIFLCKMLTLNCGLTLSSGINLNILYFRMLSYKLNNFLSFDTS